MGKTVTPKAPSRKYRPTSSEIRAAFRDGVSRKGYFTPWQLRIFGIPNYPPPKGWMVWLLHDPPELPLGSLELFVALKGLKKPEVETFVASGGVQRIRDAIPPEVQQGAA